MHRTCATFTAHTDSLCLPNKVGYDGRFIGKSLNTNEDHIEVTVQNERKLCTLSESKRKYSIEFWLGRKKRSSHSSKSYW